MQTTRTLLISLCLCLSFLSPVWAAADPFNKDLVKELQAMGIDTRQILRVGATAPDFSLINAQGQPVQLKALLKQGPVILTFYRGNWCPYCNTAMGDLAKAWPAIQKQGAQLIAISPQTQAKTKEMQGKYKLGFQVTSDPSNRVARQYGLVYKVPPAYLNKLKAFFVELKNYNGNNANELPLTATYIIQPNGKISYAFINSNYQNRAKTQVLIQHLQDTNK